MFIGGGGSGHITCGFQGGGGWSMYLHFLWRGVRRNLGNEPRSQPPPPDT